jgi:hypothetical protein
MSARGRDITEKDLAGKNAQLAMPVDGVKLIAE